MVPVKRYLSLAVVTVALAAGVVVGFYARGALSGGSSPSSIEGSLYVASDVALLGRTGRPQLVEFYHPD